MRVIKPTIIPNSFKKKPRGLLWIFFLWPMASVVMALRNFGQKEAQLVVYLFFIIFGFAFVIPEDVPGASPDVVRYVEKLKDVALLPSTNIQGIMRSLYAENGAVDLVQPLVTLVLSRFTTDPRFLLGIFAAIFGFFHLRSINLLYDQYRLNKNINSLIFFIFFISIIPIFQINGFRFWTASWVFFYGTGNFLVSKKKKYFFVALASVLFHFSFLFADIVLIAYLVFGNRNFVYFGLLVSSFFLPDLLIQHSEKIGGYFGGGLERKIIGYNAASTVEHVMNKNAEIDWYVRWALYIALYYLIAAAFYLKMKFPLISKLEETKRTFSFSLLFLACINMGKNTPSFGGRFLTVFLLFAIFFIILILSRKESKSFALITIIGLFPMLLYVAIQMRMGFEFVSPWLFAPMPFPLLGSEYTLHQLYKLFN